MSVINHGLFQTSTQQPAIQQQQQRVVSHHHKQQNNHRYQRSRRRPGPLNVVTRSRISQLQPFSNLTSTANASSGGSTAKETCCSSDTTLPSSSPSLPAVLASLSAGVLLGAAAMNVCGPDHQALVTSAISVVDSLKEFGPEDVIAQGFGSSRPVWAALMQQSSHQQASAASASASVTFWLRELSTDVAPQLHFPYTDSGGGGGGAVAGGTLAVSLMAQALGAAEGAAAVVSGALGGVCDDYNRWLQESPLTCKVVTGNLFTVTGDMLAQLGLCGGHDGHGSEAADGVSTTPSTASNRRRKVDWMRTGRLCLETSAFGTPLAHWWFNLLDSRIMPDNPHSPAAVLTKMLADQVLFAPLGLLMFFAVIKCLEGRPRDLPQTLQSSYLKTLLGGYLLWPLAGILNFALLPNEYRLLFNNCINIIWTCFLSIMSSGDDSSSKAADTPSLVGVTAITTAATSVATLGSPSHLRPVAAPAAGTVGASALITPACSSPCVASGIASDLAKAAVAAAAISAAAGDRPAFSCVAGLAVAVMGASLETYAPCLQQQQQQVNGSPQPQLVAVKMCEQHVMGAVLMHGLGYQPYRAS
ncbi:hypothetical protein Vafri_9919 [Volvox africanus]|uniref:Uncharacterized protein n=1 Tax=Volvox africanus TaxID=51714 RepID=A0A8J4F2Z0_9CHLO|nr:hypothetical protein Vafri_9919 [Volvox africanus]